MTGALVGALLAVLLVGWYAFEQQRKIYEQLFRVLERDRDLARQEAKVFRGLIFPGIQKAEGAAAEGNASGKAIPGAHAPSSPSTPLLNRRVPFRIRFNQARKLLNRKQQGTDALAAALEKQNKSSEVKPSA